MKVHIRVFVEVENLGKAMNALADAGITGFYILEYKGMSPQDWKGFSIKEDPKSAMDLSVTMPPMQCWFAVWWMRKEQKIL